MSDQDDTLLDEDLGDELGDELSGYDLGNDEEDALLADDYEIDRPNNGKGEEETDDVLELGVTDQLEDLEGDDENIQYRSEAISQSHCYPDDGIYYDQKDHENYSDEQHRGQRYQANVIRNDASVNNLSTGDLREKLQKRGEMLANGQRIEEDDCEEARDRRNRFQNERIAIAPKMNTEIPDSLESVVTEQHRQPFRGRGRGRGMRQTRGARFLGPMGPYSPRFSGRGPTFDDQKLPYRPPLLEAPPPIFTNGPPSAMMNPQMMYNQGNPHPPRFQQFPQPPGPHFPDPGPRGPFNQFQGPPHGPRPQNPRMEFRPRPLPPRFNGPPSHQPFMQPQPPYFPGSRPAMVGPHEGMMPAGGSSLLGPAPFAMGPPQGNHGPAMHPGHQIMRPPGPDGPIAPGYARLPGPSHGPPMSGPPGNSQPPYDNRQPFPEQNFEGRNVYEPPRAPYNGPHHVNHFENQSSARPPQSSTVASVPLVPGHKILINPHFRGTPQAPVDARPTWNGAHPGHSQGHGDGFGPPPPPPSHPPSVPPMYQDQGSYNSSSVNLAPPQEYKKTFSQAKNDDPYAYFSDVWQENKPSKPRSLSPVKSYNDNYSRDNYRDYDSKYKSDTRDSYTEDRGYRERSPARTREYSQRPRPQQSNSYNNDSHDQRTIKTNNSYGRSAARPPQKRTPEPADRQPRNLSPKRAKVGKNEPELSSKMGTHQRADEDLDPDMREYRKKMEEQKRLREKILQEKENRRKQAALDRQGDDIKDVKPIENTQAESQLTAVIKDSTAATLPPRGKTRITQAQATEIGEKTTTVRIVRTLQATDKTNTSNNHTKEIVEVMPKPAGKAVRRVVLQKPLCKVATSLQKKVSNLQKPITTNNSKVLVSATKAKVLPGQKTPATTPKTVRKVVKEGATAVRKVIVGNSNSVATKKIISGAQTSQRIVLPPNSKANSVLVENLAAATSEAQIKKMCQGIGTVENITMGDGNATIVFKTHSAATVFHKKYQRKMIDLSMINVRLMSQTSTNQPSTLSVKK